MTQPHIEIEITKRYGAKVVLDRFQLSIQKGQFVTLLGPSGCGKSTALGCVAGLLEVSEGAIRMDGLRIDNVPMERRGIGLVFQNYALFPHLTVFQNVGFGLTIKRVPKPEIERRVAEMLELVQLGALRDRYPAQLSGGQQQRVAIARALVLQPGLILFDEPLSNLDAKLRNEMRSEIRRLHNELGLTTIYVTHDQSEALSMSDLVVVLKDGRIQQTGAPAEVFNRPVSRFVADFMGFRNLLPVQSGADGSVTWQGQPLQLGAPLEGRPLLAIRPEDVTLGGGVNAFGAQAELIEYLGRERAVIARLANGEQLHLKTTEPVEVGQDLTLSLPPGALVPVAEDPS